MTGFYWYLSLLISLILSFGIGFQFVDILRKKCKTMKNIKRFTAVVFIAPLTVYLFLVILTFFHCINRTIADAIAFGIVFGILLQLSLKPKGPGSIKLIAKQVDGKHVDVWLDSVDIPVVEVRAKIAEALSVTPVTRVSIESGKGNFIEDMSQPLFNNIDDTLKKTDFFGYLTLNCYIHVKEEEKINRRGSVTAVDTSGEGGETKEKKSLLGSILHKPEVKFGEFLVCSAKIATNPDAKMNFQVSCVDKFVAGAPFANMQLNNTTIRLHPWSSKMIQNGVSGGESGADGEGGAHPTGVGHHRSISNETEISNDNDSNSIASASVAGGRAKLQKRSSIFFRNNKNENLEYIGKPIHHGDIVVLETNAKYMSVTRGWWMAWNSNEPRRSGAFMIEIMEKASNQNAFKEQLHNIKENIKEKIGRGNTTPKHKDAESEKEFDTILRPGDLFRLKSVKFPDFELGLTSTKIRDNYCYLGLRKVSFPSPFFLFLLYVIVSYFSF
jgi:hypothetical protein